MVVYRADEVIKPTVGLDYSYARQAAASGALATSSSKVAHIWELGGSHKSALSELLAIPLTSQRLPRNVVVLTFDLSKPADFVESALSWIPILQARLAECAAKASRNGPGNGLLAKQALLRVRQGWASRQVNSKCNAAMSSESIVSGSAPALAAPASRDARRPLSRSSSITSGNTYSNGQLQTSETVQSLASPLNGSSEQMTDAELDSVLSTMPQHPDERWLISTLVPCRMIVVGTKWDQLRGQDSNRRRAVFSALRFIAHCLGASVLTTSSKDKHSIAAFKAALARDAFSGAVVRSPFSIGPISADASKNLFIPSGADCIDEIGPPLQLQGLTTVLRASLESGLLETRLHTYKLPVEALFGTSALGCRPNMSDPSTCTLPPTPGSIVPGSTVAFNDVSATKYQEPDVDFARCAKAEELSRIVREQERKLRMEAAIRL